MNLRPLDPQSSTLPAALHPDLQWSIKPCLNRIPNPEGKVKTFIKFPAEFLNNFHLIKQQPAVTCGLSYSLHILRIVRGVRVLQRFQQLRRLTADRLAVQLDRLDAQAAGAADDHLVRVGQLLHGERRFAGRNAVLLGEHEQVPQRNARQNQVITRRRAQNAVLYHQDIVVRTLGHAVAAMENRLLTALLQAALVRDNTRNEVERLDVAVQQARILHRNQLERVVKRNQVARNREDHQVRLDGRRRKLVSAETGAIIQILKRHLIPYLYLSPDTNSVLEHRKLYTGRLHLSNSSLLLRLHLPVFLRNGLHQ